MASIPNASVHTQLWNKVFGIINAITNPSGSSAKWVWSAEPENIIDKESAYPLIIITPPEASYDPLTFTNIKDGSVSVQIDAFSTNAAQLDALSDSITNAMEDADAAFTASGVTGIKLVRSTYAYQPRSTFRVHQKTFEYEFGYRWV